MSGIIIWLGWSTTDTLVVDYGNTRNFPQKKNLRILRVRSAPSRHCASIHVTLRTTLSIFVFLGAIRLAELQTNLNF